MNGSGETPTGGPAEPAGEVLHCANHPRRETVLRCGRCGKPICTECIVQTPVGARCRECAQLRKLPMFDVRPKHYALGLAAGITAGIVAGVAVLFLFRNIPFVLWWGGLAAGWGVGNAISLATNRKMGTGLRAMAVACIVLGAVAGEALLVPSLSAGGGSEAFPRIFLLVLQRDALRLLIYAGLGSVLASTRF